MFVLLILCYCRFGSGDRTENGQVGRFVAMSGLSLDLEVQDETLGAH